jgi:hypothetical protein
METQFIDHLTGTAVPYAQLSYEQRLSLARFSDISSQAAAAPTPVRIAAAPASAPANAVPPISASRPAPVIALPAMSTADLDKRTSLLTAEATDDCQEFAKHLAAQPDVTIAKARELLSVAAGPRCSTFAEINARMRADHGKIAPQAPAREPSAALVRSGLNPNAIFAGRKAVCDEAMNR